MCYCYADRKEEGGHFYIVIPTEVEGSENMKEKVTPTQKALNLWAVILIVWAFYRNYLKMPLWFDEFIAKPLVFVLPVFYYIKKIDNKKISEYLYLRFKLRELINDFFYGLGIGLAFYLTGISASYYRLGKLIFFQKTPSFSALAYILIISLATGITEEILSRGFVLRKLYEESKNVLSATFFASILFFFLHVPILFTNTKITGQMLILFMATDMLLSMVNGLIFLQKKSLVIPILIHTFYNVVIALTFL
ncbi:hypothetical protein COY13_02270 [Candidatus Roizmanbacteria bacterium CG_4_10_14_0_2_um_filter_36_35]|uniref:CAAX prenyl protease 2/Lysostaphin resistance protein A-like domain-containing protein n=3 Tax=Candidatus Roizmaniibacteriota TaxID=1752723 RepID=A0A2M7BWZ3_9BACT|nr:MAG: hypothetical protein COV86_00385 [Candidatus Roizmanbacteria bacterium CG11_big_fil_rev_8_21_14_0_20_35_14]PIV11093.1 MAG: hypothetical protein COS50_02115 [Candidatus Roizmanbacteria bacterium CG03_land_8_20_14_0_80_35_26]PIZ67876.1 MAG: hypothetical protein COY13_02270 [Candidatus Roizmanbacteria bacterium CG_4_10_14_0_2_um_filter_36_35]PJC81015.1 MAG: hypothetical protein CO008_00390 [Candidatus Roizmanbacteria bacterium CG_4_8_14_3_um_filter_36_12]